MLCKIKNRIEKELIRFSNTLENNNPFIKTSPLLSGQIRRFILRKGKRLRPALFVLAYTGYAKKVARGLYRSALSFELLHDFFLIHDDIIDKSDMRRGEPSIHKSLGKFLGRYKNIKFNGEDLAIVIGDVMHALAVDAFLSIKEKPDRKEKALKIFNNAAACTGAGEFIEVLSGIKNIDAISKEDIYRIYDLKTARYSFAAPLSAGATLAGANGADIKRLHSCGIYLGRAFQIKDDMLGLFGDEEKTGKSPLTDLKESKKTLLLWHACRRSKNKDRRFVKMVLKKNNATMRDLLKIRSIVISSGALDYSKNELSNLLKASEDLIATLEMREGHKENLLFYIEGLLKL